MVLLTDNYLLTTINPLYLILLLGGLLGIGILMWRKTNRISVEVDSFNLNQPLSSYNTVKNLIKDVVDFYHIQIEVEIKYISDNEFTSDMYETFRNKFIEDCLEVLNDSPHVKIIFKNREALVKYLALEFDKNFYRLYINSSVAPNE